MLFLIDIHWTRRHPDPDSPSSGRTTYAEYARSLGAAKARAKRKFLRHYGKNLEATSSEERSLPTSTN